MSFAANIINDRTASLEFIKGFMGEGVPFFAYVLMRKSDALSLREQKTGLSIPLNSIILYTDYGHEVGEGVEEEVREEFKRMLKKHAN